ncbi:Protein FAR1-RELATED SEQUENCE 9 [Linum perenne]
MSANRHRILGGGAQHVLDYLKRMQAERPAFFYAVQDHDEHSAGGIIFWADTFCRTNYSFFGDAVTFNTTYRTNHFRVPFASFTGLNHHGQPVLFGCALILDESDSSFVWLFQTWLRAMSGPQPVSLTTEPDRLMQLAVAQVFPETRHRYCKQGILQQTLEALSHLCHSHPGFEVEFKQCINGAETIDEFDLSWQSLVQRYYLMDNEWLQSMYATRQQWVPVYMRNTFFGEFSVMEETGGLNAFFDDFVDASTTMQMLVKQYEKAVSSWNQKELEADNETINTTPALKTPSPMERQAANLYTKRIFMKFQEELVETLANPATRIEDSGSVTLYRVAKFGEDHKGHNVSFSSFETKATCSCQMFEFSGIICRHILAVFRAKNVLTLPCQYLLKRWTRDAKSGVTLEECASQLPNDSGESSTTKCNNLRKEAIKYVEEGAKSIHMYNVAMDALHEAAKKVSTLKSKDSGLSSHTPSANGGGQQALHGEDESAMPESMDEKERKIRELTMELERINERSQVYRSSLVAVLRDMEDQKLKLSLKVQNARLSMKE